MLKVWGKDQLVSGLRGKDKEEEEENCQRWRSREGLNNKKA
jgi:hypothetical protein